MKDILKDIVYYANGIAKIDSVKITGTDTETKVFTAADDKSIILYGTFKTAIPDFAGTFGMPHLSKLKTILSFDDYDDHAKISVVRETRDGVDIPTTIHFETKNGDFVNDYRLMSQAMIEEKLKNITFKGAVWNLTFEPSVASITRMKRQSSVDTDESVFTLKTDGNDLKVHFGNPSNHSGNFTFHSNLTGKLTKSLSWPTKPFLSIMDLSGSKTIQIADQGVMQITVDSGITNYVYLLPAKK